jgi:hypothetical protein
MKNTVGLARAETATKFKNIQNNKSVNMTGRVELTEEEMDLMLKIKKEKGIKNYDMWKEQ